MSVQMLILVSFINTHLLMQNCEIAGARNIGAANDIGGSNDIIAAKKIKANIWR